MSPYTYLALTQAEAFGTRHDVEWRLHPVVYGALLSATGLVGPAEVEVKRRYTFRDVTRTAAMLEVPLVGPPAHPFRSLEALRAVCLFGDEPEALPLSVGLAWACWGEGKDLTDLAVIAEVVAEVGLPAAALGRLGEPATKHRLRRETDEALEAGVFGVPTFAYGGELFWGHDRMPQLAARLDGLLPDDPYVPSDLERRPRGADRPGSPLHGDGPGSALRVDPEDR